MFRNRDRVMLTKSKNPTRGLDATALDEYLIGGLDCVRFKKKRDAAGFTPPAPGPGQLPDYFACQLFTLSVPQGFRRINLDDIRDEHGHREARLPPFGDRLADQPSPVEPVLLHVIYDLDTTAAAPPRSGGAATPPMVTKDFCASEEPRGVTFSGTLTPCAKSTASSWSGPGPDAQGLFVRYSWQGLYDNAANRATSDALKSLFKEKNEVALAAMLAPDRTVIWVPFLEGEEVNGGKDDYRIERYQDSVPYELGKVIYLDKPGIWVDPELRFKV